MMSAPDRLTLRTRLDDFSYQVSAEEDEKFWFRLEREEGRDLITDFFLGASPKQCAGSLLADCYRVLGLTPKTVIVFRDILPSSASMDVDVALEESREFYSACGEALLAGLGVSRVDERLERERGKYNLVLRDCPITETIDG